MAKKRITVTTKENIEYNLSFELKKPLAITENSSALITANNVVRYNIIDQINKKSSNTNLEQRHIKSIAIFCDTNPNLNSKISDLDNNFDFLFPLLINLDNQIINNDETSLLGEYVIKMINDSNFESSGN